MSRLTRHLPLAATALALLVTTAATPSSDALVSRLAPLYQRLDARDVAPHLWLAMREDPHPEVRRLAARVLSSVADPAHLPLLELYHRDGSPLVRVEAMVAAGRLGPAGAGLARAGLADVSPAVRQAASWAAAHGGTIGCEGLLARVSVERDPAVLATMVGNLFRCDGHPWEAAVLAPATSPDPDLRRAAAAALARGSGHEALDRLAHDAEPVIRATALAGMTRGPFAPGRLALVVGALDDTDWRVRAAACAVLAARAEAPLAAQAGVRLVALAREPQAHLQVAALRALGAHPEVASTTDLLAWAATESPWVAGEALDAAARRHPELALARVSDWLGSPEGWRRRAAAAAVVRQPVASRAALEARVMDDRDPAVRLAWLERLDGMPAGRGEWLRSRLADDGDPAVRSAILDLLAGAGEAGDPERLLERARAWGRDQPGDARASALLAALRGSTEEGFRRRVIARALEDPDDAVAARVVAAARELGLSVGLPAREARHGARWYRDLVTWGDEPRWLDVETGRGSFRIRLDAAAAPLTAKEVFELASSGFYDGLTIHRVVPNFVVQGGDPRGDGWGGPGFTLPDEPTVVPFDSWRVGIATSGPHTGGCQLFVTLLPADRLTGHYTNLGEVVEGREVLARLEVGDRIQRVAAISGAPGPLRLPTATPLTAAAP